MGKIKNMQSELSRYFLQWTKRVLLGQSNQLFTDILKVLPYYLQIRYVGFYIYDDQTCTYKTFSNKQKYLPSLQYLKRLTNNVKLQSYENIFMIKRGNNSLLIYKIPIISENPFYIVMKGKKEKFPTSLVLFLYYEMEQLMQVFYQFKTIGRIQQSKGLLSDLSLKVCGVTNPEEILRLMIDYLRKIYPNDQYDILLSQDYKVAEQNLPIKELDLCEDPYQPSNQAIFSGNIQIEKHCGQTYLYAPLVGHQGVYGVLRIIISRERILTNQEFKFLKKFIKVFGQALENATFYLHSMTLNENLKLMNDAAKRLNATANLSELTSIARDYIEKASGAEEIGVFYFDLEKGSNFYITKESSHLFHTDEGEKLIQYLQKCIKQEDGEIFSGCFTNQYSQLPYDSIMFGAIVQSMDILGGIVALHQDQFYFSLENYKFMRSLIQHYSLCVANTILKEKLKKAVITDYLTKLHTRRYLEDRIKEHMQKGTHGTFILFDIDDFKYINDTHGHFTGDEVIVQVARILKENISSWDIPARWGGEELAIYLPQKTKTEGYELACHILYQVEHISEPQVTLSSGISTWMNEKSDSVSELFIRADQALYAAKNAGKNQIRISS